MMDSQLAKLLVSEQIDEVAKPAEQSLYVKGYSHLSFHNEVHRPPPENMMSNTEAAAAVAATRLEKGLEIQEVNESDLD